MYHVGDYFRFLLHRGPATIFWCGSDILNLEKSYFWWYTLPWEKAKHLCENEIEQASLRNLGIPSEILPMCFDDIRINTHYKQSKTPHVYLCAQPGYEKEYGVDVIEKFACLLPETTFHIYGIKQQSKNKNVVFHGKVSNEQFTKEIKQYQAGLRLNKFDGFSEVLAKSVLMGQYPISMIKYPFITYVENIGSLIIALRNLKYNKKSNFQARDFWIKKLSIRFK